MTENYHIRLREQTAKMLIGKISENFNRRVCYKGKHYSYQSILMDNVQEVANYIVGKKKAGLQLEVPPIKIQRNDPLELQQRIMTMTSKERKRLELNKSTLWYQNKKLAKGSKIKVYRKVLSKINNVQQADMI